MAAYLEVDAEMDRVFRALADPGRRRLLDALNVRTGQTLRDLCSVLDMARQSVSKHLAVLEAANLVTTVWRGREKLHYLNAAPINEIGDRWITRYEQGRVHALADLKRALEEGKTMERPSFVYTTYIKTTPERLWEALTDPAFTSIYWGATFQSVWTVGSEMTWTQFGITSADPAQVILESDPYRRLAYRWHSFTPELLDRMDLTDEARARLVAEARSRVTFDIEPLGELVKLTVLHDDFEVGSLVVQLVSRGWPRILANLKTLLETGETLPDSSEPPPTVTLGVTKTSVGARR